MKNQSLPKQLDLSETSRFRRDVERIVGSHECIVKTLGLKGDVATLAVAEATFRDTGVNILELYGLDEESLRERVTRKTCPAGIADIFLRDLMELPDHVAKTCMEERMGKIAVRLQKALKALRSVGHEYDQMELRRQLRVHPSCIASNKSYRGNFGNLNTEAQKVWVFSIDSPEASAAIQEGPIPAESSTD